MVYFQQPRNNPGRAIGLAVIGLIYCLILALVMRQLPVPFWIMVGLGAVIALALIYNILYTLGIRQPMLTVNAEYLVFRKIHIPWRIIERVELIELQNGRFVGIALKDENLRITPKSAPASVKVTLAPIVRRDLQRYGAILIPAARGLTVDELKNKLSQAKAAAMLETQLSDTL